MHFAQDKATERSVQQPLMDDLVDKLLARAGLAENTARYVAPTQAVRRRRARIREEDHQGAFKFPGIDITLDAPASEPIARKEGKTNVKNAVFRPVAAKAGVFISYRRSDQAAMAGRLYDRLTSRFGPDQVFMDVDSIDLGLDFVQILNRSLNHCKVLIAIIGKDWLTAEGEDGCRRLDNPGDFVRMEIATALSRDIRVIPILVDGTPMPPADDLPDSLKSLAHRNGRSIANARFGSDCQLLIDAIDRVLNVK
jgi:hypothetical protein